MSYGFTTIVRKTRGDDIDAACGQLAGDVIDRTKRTLRKRMQGEVIDIKAVDSSCATGHSLYRGAMSVE